MSTQLLTFSKPVIIALFGAKGAGKTTAADMLGFPQYQFNQWAIEQVVATTNLTESHLKDASVKDIQVGILARVGCNDAITTPRQYLIDFIDAKIAEDEQAYIKANFDHFLTWLESKEVQDSYAVTLPSIRREFELGYLKELQRLGYEVIIQQIDREDCEFSEEHVTETDWVTVMVEQANIYGDLIGGGYFVSHNSDSPRYLANQLMCNVAGELAERASYE